MQHQITQRTRLLDAQGNVAEPGYCVHNLYDYARGDIRANPLRIENKGERNIFGIKRLKN